MQIKPSQNDLAALDFYNKVVSPQLHSCIELLDKEAAKLESQQKIFIKAISSFDYEFDTSFSEYKCCLYHVNSDKAKLNAGERENARNNMIQACLDKINNEVSLSELLRSYKSTCLAIRKDTLVKIRSMRKNS